MRRSIAVLAAVLLFGGLASTASAHVASPASPGPGGKSPWKVMKTPTVAGSANAVSADSATDAWAVGCDSCATDPTHGLLVEHRTGQKWSLASVPPTPSLTCPAPFNPESELWSVKAFSATDVWVGGSTNCGSNFPADAIAYIDNWNGSEWNVQTLAAGITNVNSIDGFSDTHLWFTAVGDGSPTAQGSVYYGGTQGFTLMAQSPVGSNQFGGVFARAPRHAYAAADDSSTQQPVFYYGGITAATWHAQELPAALYGRPTGITASSPSDIWIGGSTTNDRPWVIHFDGAQWTLEAVRGHSRTYSPLSGIAENGSSDVWAVGRALPRDNSERNLLTRWNGTTWTYYTKPRRAYLLTGITAIPGGGFLASGAGIAGPAIYMCTTGC